jgi:hypothetical protein
MPNKVRIAVILMSLLWAAGVVYLAAAWFQAKRLGIPSTTMLAISYSLILLLLAVLIRAVALGGRLARTLYSVFAIIAVGSIVVGWLSGATSSFQLLVGAPLVVLYATILALLFHSESASWFKRQRRNAT